MHMRHHSNADFVLFSILSLVPRFYSQKKTTPESPHFPFLSPDSYMISPPPMCYMSSLAGRPTSADSAHVLGEGMVTFVVPATFKQGCVRR